MPDPTPAETILADNRERIATLTPREREVLQLTCKGYTANEVAAMMSLSKWTVMTHRINAQKKLDVSSSVEAAVIAAKAGLV